MRAIALAVALSSWVIGGTPASAQPAVTAPNADTDPIVRVTVDLAGRTFDRVLPFDVPFFIVGQAPEGTVLLSVQYVELEKKGAPPTEDWKPATAAVWKPDAPAAANEPFLVFLSETLDAERYFRFRFTFERQPSAEQTLQFRESARPIFDEVLRTFVATGVMPGAQEIRAQLAALIPAVTGDPKWTPAPGSFFDTKDQTAAALDKVLREVAGSLGPLLDRQEILGGFVTVRLLIHQGLVALQSSDALKSAIAAAREIDDAGIRELLTLDAEGLALVTMPRPDLDLAAAGGVAGDLADVWQPAGAAERAANYRQLLRRLQQLEHFVRAVSDADGAARPAVEGATSPAVVAGVAALGAGTLRTTIAQAMRLSLDMTRLEQGLTARDRELVKLTDFIAVVFRDVRYVVGSSVADGNTTQTNYVSADGGVLYAGDIGQAALFVGTNIYFRPVNKDAPLRQKGSFGRRFAVTVGVTLSSIEDEGAVTRTDLFADSSLVLGAGLRITQSLRLGGGAIIFKESDPNPLVTKKTAAATWYVSFSFDINVAKGLQGLGGQFE
jgi:hypothetical protein